MLRIVYLTAVLLAESAIPQLKVLGYAIQQMENIHLVGFEWPEGHHYGGLSENPLYMKGGGRFCIEYTPQRNERGKFFCPSYPIGGVLNSSARLYGPTMYEVVQAPEEPQVRRYVITQSERFGMKGFEKQSLPQIRHIVSYPSSVERLPKPVVLAAAPHFPELATRVA